MSKSDKKAVAFTALIIITFGFILGYLTAMMNIEPQIIEKEVVKVEYVNSAADEVPGST